MRAPHTDITKTVQSQRPWQPHFHTDVQRGLPNDAGPCINDLWTQVPWEDSKASPCCTNGSSSRLGSSFFIFLEQRQLAHFLFLARLPHMVVSPSLKPTRPQLHCQRRRTRPTAFLWGPPRPGYRSNLKRKGKDRRMGGRNGELGRNESFSSVIHWNSMPSLKSQL